ncbi:hypothetical protein BX667DRAFT_499368 [Coemansia mojavensis]|nr:hypothetical protein BX667DRAFT_499368 [Coemansia mojavensis]
MAMLIAHMVQQVILLCALLIVLKSTAIKAYPHSRQQSSVAYLRAVSSMWWIFQRIFRKELWTPQKLSYRIFQT